MHRLHFAIPFLLLAVNIGHSNSDTILTEIRALGLSSGSVIGVTSKSTQRWSNYYAPSFVTAVKPATDDDVAKIVIFELCR